MNNQEIKISIVIIGYNTESYLYETLKAIDKLKVHQENIEIIYVDDGSNDKSCDIFNSTTLSYRKKMFKLKENSGRVIARSKGIELAEYDWILFLNSNIVVSQNLIIEYDGEQHFKPVQFGTMSKKEAFKEFKIRKRHDKMKNIWARNNKINFLRIKYDENPKNKIFKKLKQLNGTLAIN